MTVAGNLPMPHVSIHLFVPMIPTVTFLDNKLVKQTFLKASHILKKFRQSAPTRQQLPYEEQLASLIIEVPMLFTPCMSVMISSVTCLWRFARPLKRTIK